MHFFLGGCEYRVKIKGNIPSSSAFPHARAQMRFSQMRRGGREISIVLRSFLFLRNRVSQHLRLLRLFGEW